MQAPNFKLNIPALFTRANKTIACVETGKVESFKTVNLAKKASRKLTATHGVGSVRLA